MLSLNDSSRFTPWCDVAAAITGCGLRVPGASRVSELWLLLVNSKCAGSIETFDGLPYRSRVAVAKVVGSLCSSQRDRSVDLGLAAVASALGDHPRFHSIPPDRRAIVVATALGPIGALMTTAREIAAKDASVVGPRTVPNLMVNGLSAAIALQHNCQGPAHTVSTACASGTDALGLGMQMIDLDVADVVIVCGADAPVRADVLAGFQRLGALSAETEDAARACRPFDVERTGFMMAEGACCLILEHIHEPDRLGSVVSYGSTSDAHHLVAPRPDGSGAKRAMMTAIERGHVDLSEIGHVNAHGTGTSLNDAAEARAINGLLGSTVPVWSAKGSLGHLMGAAGVAEALATVLALGNSLIPPTAGLNSIDPEIARIDLVVGRPRPLVSQYALSNSFAFGGHNACVLLGT